MALQYDPAKIPHYTYVDEDSMTEQEHLESTDINEMVARAKRGAEIRSGHVPVYGTDDTTMDGLTLRITKAKLEQELKDIGESNEFTNEELKQFDPQIVKKFGFKTKKSQLKTPAQNENELNENENAGLDSQTEAEGKQKGSKS